MNDTLQRATLQLDLTGGSIRTGGKGAIPPGYYPVVIREAGVYTAASGNQSVKLVAEVTEGEWAGSSAWIFLGLDTSKEGTKNSWQTTLVSLGYDPQTVNAAFHLDTDMLCDRPGYLRVRPTRDDAAKFDRDLVTREEYDRSIAKTAPVGMTVTSAPTMRTATVTTAPVVAAPTMTTSVGAPTFAIPQPGGSKLGNFLKR